MKTKEDILKSLLQGTGNKQSQCVVLIGPDRPNQFKLNDPAALLVPRLAIPYKAWNKVHTAVA